MTYIASTRGELKRAKTIAGIRNVRFAGDALSAYQQLDGDSLGELDHSDECNIEGDTVVIQEIVNELLDIMPYGVTLSRKRDCETVCGGRRIRVFEDE